MHDRMQVLIRRARCDGLCLGRAFLRTVCLLAVAAGPFARPVGGAQPARALPGVGLDNIAAGPLPTGAGTDNWNVPETHAGTMQASAGPAHARGDGMGLELKRGRHEAVLVRRLPDLAPGIYEFTLWARGEGDFTLGADANRRRLALGEEWQPYSLVFEIAEPATVTLQMAAGRWMEADGLELWAAGADLREAWRKQEEARLQLGFVPAAASAQRPAPGRTAREWSIPEERLAWTAKAVYFDARYDAAHIRNADRLTLYLAQNGFVRRNAEQLSAWIENALRGGAYGTVLVMSMGVAPSSVFPDGSGRDALLFRYMESGGRVLWLGDVPFYYTQTPDGTSLLGQQNAYQNILGVRGGWHTLAWGNRSVPSAEMTELGRRWGLERSSGPIIAAYVEDVTAPLSVFYSEDAQAQLTVNWFKNFNPDAPWSGMIWTHRGADAGLASVQREVYRLALYAGAPVDAPEPRALEPDPPACGIELRLSEPHDRSCYVRGETLAVRVRLQPAPGAPAPGIVQAALHEAGGTLLASRVFRVDDTTARLEWLLETADLACGAYTLRVAALGHDEALGFAEREVHIAPAPRRPGFYFTAWAPNPEVRYRADLLLERMQSAGLHPGNFSSATHPYLLDHALRYGLVFSLRAHGKADGPFEEGSLRVTPDGVPVPSAWGGGRPMRSLISPVYREQMAASMEAQLREVIGYPALLPYCHTVDDYSVRYGLDYSEITRAAFRRETGLEAPAPPEILKLGTALNSLTRLQRPYGAIPEDDPWLLWQSFTTREVGGGFNRALLEGSRRAIPGIRLGPVPGGMQLPLWSRGQYPPHHFGEGGFNLAQYYYYVNYWQPLTGALYWDEIARMHNRDLELWVTAGLYNRDEPTYYRNKFFLHMAGGVNGFNYYSYRDGETRPRGLAEVGRLGREVVKPYAPLFGRMRRARASVGLLIPYAQACIEMGYPVAAVYTHANLLGAHIDAEPTCEEELISGDARRYDAILLWNCAWIRQRAFDALADYIAAGGRVLADRSTRIEIPGMQRLDVDLAMGGEHESRVFESDARMGYPGINDYLVPERVGAVRAALMEHVPPQIDSPSSELVIRRHAAAGIGYLWLVNVHTHEDYMYLRPRIGAGARPPDPAAALEEALAYLAAKDAADGGIFTAPVTVPAGEEVLYDVLHGREIPVETTPGGRRFNAVMQVLGGQLVAFYPRRVASVVVEAPETFSRGVEARVVVRVLDAEGRPLPGHHPVRLEISHGQGLLREWTGSHVTDDGVLSIAVRPALNHARGAWEIRAVESASGVEGRAAVWLE